jgi:hypothetical protein
VSVRRKARMLQTNFICADTKLIRAKEALIIGRYSARLISQSIAKCSAGSRDYGAAAVAHRPLKSSADFRTLSASIGPAKQ